MVKPDGFATAPATGAVTAVAKRGTSSDVTTSRQATSSLRRMLLSTCSDFMPLLRDRTGLPRPPFTSSAQACSYGRRRRAAGVASPDDCYDGDKHLPEERERHASTHGKTSCGRSASARRRVGTKTTSPPRSWHGTN